MTSLTCLRRHRRVPSEAHIQGGQGKKDTQPSEMREIEIIGGNPDWKPPSHFTRRRTKIFSVEVLVIRFMIDRLVGICSVGKGSRCSRMSPFCRQTPISGPATGLSWLLRDGTWRWAYATFGGLAHVRGVHARMEKGLSGRGCLRHVRLAVLRLLYFCTPPTGDGGTVPDRPRCGPSSTCICTVMARRRLIHLSRKRWLFHSITQPS